MIAEPVELSPTKPIALMAGCSVSALPASSPKPWTVLSTPSGTPASLTSFARMAAVTGDHSAGLCTTVQPAARAGAIFQVESMNGVFHGVITPTGPIGTRVETFQCSSLGVFWPSRASPHRSAKKRKFSAARIAALAMKRWAWPVSMHSSTAMSSALSSMASATRCSSFFRIAGAMSRQDLKARAAAVAARSTSSALPRATLASIAPSTGDLVSNVSPEIDGTILPSIIWPMPSARSVFSSGAMRSRLAWNTSVFGVGLSMGGLRFQGVVDVVALPARVLVVDLHVEREGEFRDCEDGIEMPGERLEDMLAGRLAGWQIAAFADAQHHVEKAVVLPRVRNRIMLASDGADADAAEREDAGLDRRLAHHLARRADVEAVVEIGRIFDREMRHRGFTPCFLVRLSEVAAHRAVGAIIGLDCVALAGLDRTDERAGEHDLSGLERKAERCDLVGEPGNGRGGMIEHAGGKAGLFELAVLETQRTDPSQIGVKRADRPSAEHDAGIRRVIGDGIENLSRRLGLGIDALDPRVQNLQRRHHEVGGVEHVEQRAVGACEALAHDEGELGFHPRGDEALRRDQATIGEEHVVQQHAGIRLVDAERALHRLRGQADFVSPDDAPLGNLDVDPSLLNRVGVSDADVGKVLRELPDLCTGLFRLVQTVRASSDIVVGKRHL